MTGVTKREYAIRAMVVFVFVLLGLAIVAILWRKKRRNADAATGPPQDDRIESVDKPPFGENDIDS